MSLVRISCMGLLLLGANLQIHAQEAITGRDIRSEAEAAAMVRSVLKTHPVIDGHSDFYHAFYDCDSCRGNIDDYDLRTMKGGITSIPLYRKGGVAGQLYNIYGRDRKTENLLKAFDLMSQMVLKYPNDMVIAGSADDLRQAALSNKIALLPILEGAVLLQDDLALLRTYYKLGLRSVTMAYKTNNLADGSDDIARHHGLSASGREMIAEMNRLGIIIDMSHTSAESMRAILKETKSPVIFSHSNAYTLCKVNRNVPDDVLLELRKNRGLIMINVVPFFISQQHADWLAKAEHDWILKLEELRDTAATDRFYTEVWLKEHPEPVVTVKEVADHFDYIKAFIGVDYIGIGSDLGANYEYTINEMADVSCFPKLLTELARRGWSESDLQKISRNNFLRVFEEVEKNAGK